MKKSRRPKRSGRLPNAHSLQKQGDMLLAASREAEAVAAYSKALEFKPNDLGLRCRLGLALQAAQRLTDAERVYSQVLVSQPKLAPIRMYLGQVQRDLGRWAEAAANLRRALREDPSLLAARFALVDVLEQLEGNDATAAEMLTITSCVPDNAEALCSAAQLLAQQGDREGAVQLYQRATVVAPAHTVAYLELARIRRLENVEALQALLPRDDLNEPSRAMVRFALAWCHHHRGDYDQAFVALEEANQTLAGKFDPRSRERLVDALIQGYSRAYFEDAPAGGNPSQLPVFVVGMPRSGTTLLERALGSHPAVYGAGELRSMAMLALEAGRGNSPPPPFPANVLAADAAQHEELARTYLDLLPPARGDALRVVDKLPDNYLRLGLIARLFPRATIIHCRRNSMDVGLSCYFQQFTRNSQNWAYDLAHIGSVIRQHDRLLEHWRTDLPLKLVGVDYETLVTDFQPTMTRLLEACGLDWDDRCCRFFEGNQRVRSASSWEVREPVHTGSVGRWELYQDHLGPLRKAIDGEAERQVAVRPR